MYFATEIIGKAGLTGSKALQHRLQKTYLEQDGDEDIVLLKTVEVTDVYRSIP